MDLEREKPSEMRYTKSCKTATKPQGEGLPSESIYRIRARKSRQFRHERRSSGDSVARDRRASDASSAAPSRERFTGRDNALWRAGIGATVCAAVSGGKAARRVADAVQAPF